MPRESKSFKIITNNEIYDSIQNLHSKLESIVTTVTVCESRIKHNRTRIEQIESIGKIVLGAVISGAVGIVIFVVGAV